MKKRTCRICDAKRPGTRSPKGWKHFDGHDYCSDCRDEMVEYLNHPLLDFVDEYEMDQIVGGK